MLVKLELRKKEECKFDMISLGEIMLRLDPGEGRIKTARLIRAIQGSGRHVPSVSGRVAENTTSQEV